MPNLITTFKGIKSHGPCEPGWRKLLDNMKPDSMDEAVTIEQILDSNGLKDALWALRCWKYEDYCLLLVNIGLSVVGVFEKKYPSDNRPRQALDTAAKYKAGNISHEEIVAAAEAAYDAAACAEDNDNEAAACAACAAANAANAAYSVVNVAYVVAHDASAAAAADGGSEAVQWKTNEKLMRQWIES